MGQTDGIRCGMTGSHSHILIKKGEIMENQEKQYLFGRDEDGNGIVNTVALGKLLDSILRRLQKLEEKD